MDAGAAPEVGVVHDYKYVRNKPESEFLTGKAEYSRFCDGLRSCLSIDGVLELFECGPLLPYGHLASTDVIYVISVLRSFFGCVSNSGAIIRMNNWGEPERAPH